MRAMSTSDSLLLDGRVMCSALAAKTGQNVLHKQIFVTELSARAAADRANTKYQPYRKLSAYVCEHCGYWHIGRLSIDTRETKQDFIVVGAQPEIFSKYLLLQTRPLGRDTNDVLTRHSAEVAGAELMELGDICHSISQPFYLNDAGWGRVLSVGPEYWAVLQNLHLPLQNQVVMRVEGNQPLLCRFWSNLPEYSFLWHVDNLVTC